MNPDQRVIGGSLKKWRRPLIAGVAAVLAYGLLLVVFVAGSWFESSTVSGFGTAFLWTFYFFPATFPCRWFGLEGPFFLYALNAVFWFLAGAISATLVRRAWQVVLVLGCLALGIVILGFSALTAIVVGSGP